MNPTVTRSRLHQDTAGSSGDLTYWLSQSVQARLDAVEMLRQDYLRLLPDDAAGARGVDLLDKWGSPCSLT